MTPFQRSRGDQPAMRASAPSCCQILRSVDGRVSTPSPVSSSCVLATSRGVVRKAAAMEATAKSTASCPGPLCARPESCSRTKKIVRRATFGTSTTASTGQARRTSSQNGGSAGGCAGGCAGSCAGGSAGGACASACAGSCAGASAAGCAGGCTAGCAGSCPGWASTSSSPCASRASGSGRSAPGSAGGSPSASVLPGLGRSSTSVCCRVFSSWPGVFTAQ
mmetsp:Transcript_100112/g.311317  ORF Transcript_100112/g.311317 Transcript_100112/m.311317 type:complete len:221 (-) Transcript_100112:504-1166(-)